MQHGSHTLRIGAPSIQSSLYPAVNSREITWELKHLSAPSNHRSRQIEHIWSQGGRKHALCNADGRPEEERQALSFFLLDNERYTLNGEVPCTLRLVPPSASQCYIYTKSDISMTLHMPYCLSSLCSCFHSYQDRRLMMRNL